MKMNAKPSKFDVKSAMMYQIASARKNNESNKRYKVQRIRADLNSYYNSLSILTGAQGKGKTFSALSEIITISYLPETHIIIYVKKKDYDETVEAIRSMSNVPIIDVGYDEAESVCRDIFQYKNDYNKLRREALEDNIDINDIPSKVLDQEALQTMMST